MAIAHRRIGTGPVRAIVLHDWFGTSAHWGSALEYLDPEGFSYAFPDYRGYGDRKDVPGRWTVPEIADDVLALTAELVRSTWQAWYPDCRVHTLPGSGHYPPHETPVAFVTEAEAFLRT
ncbi:hypothetical protein [Streptomyces sp. G-G2]|uniref:alpha/beta fold hydrolase n=1 Tax=Streptomyces sp. G-G2 TaxID=3046201 RepID=UPI0024BA4105|nr:hypothetical protein [Streptomyces sp. G-G2]MDJ0380272.1 hypothetical protein [Streptomyces sp. G-G2]